MGRTSLLFVLLMSLPALSLCDPLFILTAPNVLRIDSEENVILEAHNFGSDIDVTIYLQDFPARERRLWDTTIALTSVNKYIAKATVKIPANLLPKLSRGNQYVYLEASSPNFKMQTVILVSHQAGHIFIQTDKPIYTPTQTVLYRLLSVDNEMKPNKKAKMVQLVNPQDVIVERTEVRVIDASGIGGKSFPIPEIANIGMWKIIASYKDAPTVNFTTRFEVKEYVLPSFEVTLGSVHPFFQVDDRELHITITARFTYGKPVQGRAFILFGIMKSGEKLSIAKSLQSVPVVDGRGEAILTKEQLMENFENIDELVGSSIYVSASVITHAGSDMVEAEKTDIKIVRSPYTISFSKTSKYYKPGMPFDMMVYVANPDGSPANRIAVKADGFNVKSKTHADGVTSLTVNTPGIAGPFRVEVSTDAPELSAHQQAHATMVAFPYATQRGSKNYLHISIQHKELHAGDDDLLVHLNIENDDDGTREQISYFTYMLISNGKIVDFGRQLRTQNQRVVTLQFPIKANLIPSFRLLVYYYVVIGGQVELVADSVWIDVEDTCMGHLKISATNPNDEKKIYSPGGGLTMKLTGDPGAKVGLVAVDKAVFALSKKNKITQSKIWSVVEKNDIGCTPGSGRDVFGVFSDAGLAFVTSTDLKTETRTELRCKQPNLRKRRATALAELKSETLQKFKTTLLQRCCNAGFTLNLMLLSCSNRARRITKGNDCRNAFKHCCETVTKYMGQLQKSTLRLGRSTDEDYVNYEDITVRSQFPESWLWHTYTLPQGKNGVASVDIMHYLKDSITTWEIQAVSVSPTEGVCIAEPYDVTVLKDFFIDLRLPYATVRYEQVEIRAVLYNYHHKDITVRVQFPYNENMCSNAKRTERYTTIIKIPKKSTAVVPYVIIPLTIGEIMIEVKASVNGVFVNDAVRKPLRVLPEGIKTELPVDTHDLNPKGKEQVFNVSVLPPKDMVPRTEPLIFISAQGDLLTQSIEKTIDGLKLKHLIRIPRGSGEQNMASMTPVVIVVKYLDEKNEWPLVGEAARETALKNIQTGYIQELVYRKEEGSFAAFTYREASTWLTAYVAKVFAMARNMITIEPHVLCGAVRWLILNRQKPDGHFEEIGPVIHGEMIGGIHGESKENHAPLTAFVLIAIIEARSACSQYVVSYENSIEKGAAYLEDHIDALQGSYGAVLTAYALSLLGTHKREVVMKFASADQSHWPVGGDSNSRYTIEATGYALLFLLQQKQYDQAGKLVKWLSKRSEYGGGYSSTQATIVALQAQATYLTDAPQFKKSDLDIDLSIPSKQLSFQWSIRPDVYSTRSRTFNAFENFTVTANGHGQGSIKILTTYYAMMPKGIQECKNFDLDIVVEGGEKVRRPEGAQNSLLLKICARYHGDTPSSMVILDVSMLTGFTPDSNDLEQLKNGIENYISRFEVDKALSTAGSLIIYLDTVSNVGESCIAFHVHQYFKVGLIQPAAIKIYEYYDTTKTCTKFYNVPEHSAMLSKICQGDVCRCAEGSCVSIKTDERELIKRDDFSCAPGTDYVYKVTFIGKGKIDSYIYYAMKILAIIKQGSDAIAQDDERDLITHANCNDKFNVELNQDYLIMGQGTDLWDDKESVRYLIGENTWIERWPSNAECQEEIFRELCTKLRGFAGTLSIFGCDN
ncbi:complement C3-like isoform X2 [Amblyraja radiata]|uniref:complement C3-like isoform X2 n=1 Tax=Amblyraja radiata TaxID=386614 RepID=UPI00140346A8|nr:complement C3-like isoform X2 [Amblyraja radiata]